MEQIQALSEQGIYVGLQMDDAGLQVWVTDRYYRGRVDHHIRERTADATDAALSRWLDHQARQMRPAAAARSD